MSSPAEKPCVVSSIATYLIDNLTVLKEANEVLNIIPWSEFIRDSNPDFTKVQGMIQSPIEPIEVTEELLSKLTNLKVISNVGVGVDHLNLPLILKHDVRVGSTPDVVTQSTADLAFTLMMAIGRRLPEMMDAARGYEVGEEFDVQRSHRCCGQDIFEATLGIVGMGKIGLEIARRAQGFRMKILYYNRTQRSKEVEESVSATYVGTLDDLLPQVDYLMLSAPLTSSNRHMIAMEQLKLMKPSSYIINIARGGLIKTDDLLDALRSKTIAGAALDATEPNALPKHHPLLHMPNVIVTPHAGVFTEGGLNRIYGLGFANLRAALEGRPMPFEITE